MFRKLTVAFAIVSLAFSTGCKSHPDTPASTATIYFGGDILTMDGNAPEYVEAVVQDGNKIAMVGSKADALTKFPSARQVDLHGKTLLPGMIDSHLHLSQFILVSAVDRVDPTKVHDADAYIEHLKTVAAAAPPDAIIVSYGYEKLLIPPYRNLTRVDLDKASSTHPIFAIYNNFHWATANTPGLAKLKFDRNSPTQMEGGGVVFKDDKGEPTGLLTESAVFPIASIAGAQVTPEQQAEIPYKVANSISANGVTTVADLTSGTGGGLKEILGLQKLANDDRFALRISATPIYQVLPEMKGPIPWDGKFQASRCKLLMDASLNGGTAATIKPQLNGSTGNLNYTPEAYEKAIRTCMDKGFSVATHVMGDRAHKVMLKAFENVSSSYDLTKFHNVIEHSAIIDPADIPRIKKLNLSVGFLTPFVNAYGDPLRDMVLGEPMASRLFAAVDYDKIGINTAHHSDGPIVDAKPMYLVWCAVNRITASGKVLGPDLRQAPYPALLGVTRNAAIHLGLENEIGSLRAGKLADFAIVSDNPLKVDPLKIRDITVLTTIKDGKVYFQK